MDLTKALVLLCTSPVLLWASEPKSSRDVGRALSATFPDYRKQCTNPESHDEALFMRCMGQIEGRIGCELPRWWIAHVRDRISGVFSPKSNTRWPWWKRLGAISLPPGIVAIKKADGIQLKSGDDAVFVPQSLVDANEEPDEGLCIAIARAGENAILVLPQSRKVLSIDSKTGKTLWESRLKGIHSFRTGIHLPDTIDIRCTKKTVIVFGGESFGAYVQVFDRATGKSQMADCFSALGAFFVYK